jgi:uncharacterized iron-regulated membrane protein
MTDVKATSRRRAIMSLHRWLAVFVAPIAVIVSLTGSVLVFEHELIRTLYPDLVTVQGTGEIASASRILAAAEQAGRVRYFRYPDFPSEPIRAVVSTSGGDATVLIDPFNAALIGPEPGFLFPLLFEIHTNLMLGDAGHMIGGVIGFALALCVILGVIVWWPRAGCWKDALLLRGWRSPPSAFLNIHRVVGIYGALLLTLCALTGAAMVFRAPLSAIAVGLGGVPFNAAVDRSPAPCRGDIDAMVARTRDLLPEGRLTYVTPPQWPGDVTRIRVILPGEVHPNGRSFVTFDCRGLVLDREIAPSLPLANQILDQLVYPLHTGFALGLPGRIAILFAGLTPAILAVTGITTWARRRFRRRT